MPHSPREPSLQSPALEITDSTVAVLLRAAVHRYIDAIDDWETAYREYYRMPGEAPVGADMEAQQREFLAASRELQNLLPHARRLCLKHSLRDPFQAMLHVNLGARAPQSGDSTALGYAERRIISQCLEELDQACRAEDQTPPVRQLSTQERIERSGVFRRIVDFFL